MIGSPRTSTGSVALPIPPLETEIAARSRILSAPKGSVAPPQKIRRLVELGELFERRLWREHARACYERALELGESLADRGPYLLALRRTARLSQSFGELERALHLYEAAYELACAAGALHAAAAAATGLGNVRVDQGKWEQAESHYTAARAHADEAVDEVQAGPAVE